MIALIHNELNGIVLQYPYKRFFDRSVLSAQIMIYEIVIVIIIVLISCYFLKQYKKNNCVFVRKLFLKILNY